VPWMRLPRIRRAAPEFYDSLHYHTSWTRLLVRFIVDPTLGLHSRAVRTPAPPDAEKIVASEVKQTIGAGAEY
jgi:hypothetical protein